MAKSKVQEEPPADAPVTYRIRYGVEDGKVVERRLSSREPDPEGFEDSPKKLKLPKAKKDDK